MSRATWRVGWAVLFLAVSAVASPLDRKAELTSLVQAKKYVEAEALASQLINLNPKDIDSNFCLLQSYQENGQDTLFFQALNSAVDRFKPLNDATVDRFQSLGRFYFDRSRWAEAGATYEALLRGSPKSAKLQSDLGTTFLKRGDLDTAIQDFKRAAALDPLDGINVGNLGEASIYARDFKEAKDYLERAAALGSDPTLRYFDLAVVAMANGPRASLSQWATFFAHEAEHPDKQLDFSAHSIENAIERGMGDAAIFDLAKQFNESGGPKYALPLLTYLQKRDPQNSSYHFFMAQSYELLTFPILTERELLSTLHLDLKRHAIPADALFFTLGRTEFVLKKYEDGIRYLLGAQKVNASMIALQYTIGWGYLNEGDVADARGYFKKCLKLKNNKSVQSYCRSNLAKLAPLRPEEEEVFATYAARAKRDLRRAKSKTGNYDDIFGKYLGTHFANAVAACANDLPKGTPRRLRFVFQIESTGAVKEAHFLPQSPVSTCIAMAIAEKKAPRPPFNGFFQEMNFGIAP